MTNNRGKTAMNFNQSQHTSSTLESEQPLHEMYNFMPMSSTSTQIDHDQIEAIRHASFINEVEQNMQRFWSNRLSEINTPIVDAPTANSLSLSRIRKVIKSNEKVEMMRSDVPVLIAKACEYFVMELGLRASMHTQQNNRRKLSCSDIVEAIGDEQHLAFLAPTQSQHQELDLPSVNYNDEVYIPQPIPSEEPVMRDHHFAFPMNLDDNVNHDFFMRSRDIQENIPNYPQPPSPSGDGVNLHFKDFFK